jgi:predicted DCC family thiol-disulfide oxidoreductase YuxK
VSAPPGPVLFYDGGCGLCHASVRLLLRLDRAGRLRFAPLRGATFDALVPGDPARTALPDSLVLVGVEGSPLVRTAAVLAALRATGRLGRALSAVVGLVPRRLADTVYDATARVRRRAFAVPAEACPVRPGRGRERFLP